MPPQPHRLPIYPASTRLSHYTLLRRIGHGGFGDVYLALDSRDGQYCAVKAEMVNSHRKSIISECEILRALSSAYFPRVIEHGSDSSSNYFMMDLLGPSVSALRRQVRTRRFQLPTVLSFARLSLKMIARLHSFGFIHRDIKPSNFLVRPRSNSPLCLTDFGLARRYRDSATGEHVRQNGKGRFTGTLKYASPNAHKGIELTRRDDLMSWFYTVLEMHSRKLPWDGISDRHEALVAKEAADVAELCEGLPPNFVRIFEYIKNLGFSEDPDYEFLLGLIGDADKLDLSEWDTLLDRVPSNIDLVPRITTQLTGSYTCPYNKKAILGERIGNLAPTARLLPDAHNDEPVFCCCWSFRALHV